MPKDRFPSEVHRLRGELREMGKDLVKAALASG